VEDHPLEPNTTYRATVEGTEDGDMKAVKDRGGTPMATDYTFSLPPVGASFVE
jgi:hypothetical protein